METAKILASTAPLAASGARSQAGAAGWKTVAASAFGLTVGPSCLTILAFGAFVAPLDREFGWGVAAIANGASIISIMIMLLSPLQGFLVDRFGGRRLVLWSIPFFAASLCCMYLLPNNLTLFYLAWIVIPACGLGVWPISYLRSTAGWFDKKLGLALGVANSGIGFGTMLVPLIAGYLIAQDGWREAYLVLGVIALTAWPVAYFFLSDPAPAKAGVALSGETLGEAARTRPFWITFAAFFFLGIFSTSLIVHQVKVMIDAGIAPPVATSIPSAFGLALILGRLCTGWLLDRFAASRVMGVLLCGGAIGSLIYSRGPDVPMAIAGALLIGFVVGAEFDVLAFLIPRYHGRRAFGKIYGVMFAVFQLAGAIGVAVLGKSREALGSYATPLVGLTVVCLAAAVLFALLGPYKFAAGESAPALEPAN